MREHAKAAIRSQTIDASAIPKIVVAFGARNFALPIRPALDRVGEVEAAIRVTNNIVGTSETPALVIVHQGFQLAICSHTREAPVIAFAHDQTALQIERRTVPPDRDPDEIWCFPWGQPKKLVLTQINKIPITIRMPCWPFSEDETGREPRRFGRFKHFGQMLGAGHDVILSRRNSIEEPVNLPLSSRRHVRQS